MSALQDELASVKLRLNTVLGTGAIKEGVNLRLFRPASTATREVDPSSRAVSLPVLYVAQGTETILSNPSGLVRSADTASLLRAELRLTVISAAHCPAFAPFN